MRSSATYRSRATIAKSAPESRMSLSVCGRVALVQLATMRTRLARRGRSSASARIESRQADTKATATREYKDGCDRVSKIGGCTAQRESNPAARSRTWSNIDLFSRRCLRRAASWAAVVVVEVLAIDADVPARSFPASASTTSVFAFRWGHLRWIGSMCLSVIEGD